MSTTKETKVEVGAVEIDTSATTPTTDKPAHVQIKQAFERALEALRAAGLVRSYPYNAADIAAGGGKLVEWEAVQPFVHRFRALDRDGNGRLGDADLEKLGAAAGVGAEARQRIVEARGDELRQLQYLGLANKSSAGAVADHALAA